MAPAMLWVSMGDGVDDLVCFVGSEVPLVVDALCPARQRQRMCPEREYRLNQAVMAPAGEKSPIVLRVTVIRQSPARGESRAQLPLTLPLGDPRLWTDRLTNE
jgi:hypothetical protein